MSSSTSKTISILFAATTTIVMTAALIPRQPTVFLVGDSTMADKPLIGNPERGWGQLFPMLFDSSIAFENHARNGKSTKSFLAEGRWNVVLQQLQAGDYVLIQFGHNDAKKEDTTRFADARTLYKANLLRFIRDARGKEANPMLITPVCRRRFDVDGKFYDVLGEYPTVVREIGKEENIPVVDLNKRSAEWLSALGVQKSKPMFLWADPAVFSAFPMGKKDDTHFVSLGAIEVAKLVAGELRRLDSPLARFLKPAEAVAFEGVQKIVLLDNFYNNEWRKDSTDNEVRFHYLWHDSTNSGYSVLADIIAKTGAVVDTLCQEPNGDNLNNADVYIIVDPDTPQETTSPNVMNGSAAAAIAEWVKMGGVLVLLHNDKGNAEFQHFNMLAEHFGMRFNEDSRNRVTGRAFQTGTFEKFPVHPLFKNLRRVFIKELSTLEIRPPAEALYKDSEDVIIAFTRYGKGAVFAVGDPWFYNEYMGTWRLPEGYDNARAAGNLFRWLLSLSPTDRRVHIQELMEME